MGCDIGLVAYKLELPEELSNVNTFHVSNLKKCLSDESLVIPMKELRLDDKLNFVEEPVEIIDREVKQLKQSRIPIVKVRWNSKRGLEFTWEREDQIRANIKENDQQKLLSILPFVKGNLLVRYLGVPLISKRIGIKECVSLIEKVKAKVNHWRNRFLTYAGKLQLIASVLESILSYWCCMFLLPKTVINDINSIMKIYLWSQSHDSKGKAKVAWKNVSTVKLKGVSIWVVQKEECDSWGWKNLLTIRDLIINHVLYKISNGENTFMWYDNWSGLRPLINNISHIILYNARLQKESNVADMIADGSWINGSKWVNSVGLSIILVPMIKQGKKDKIMWLDNSGNPTKFKMCKVYDDLRCYCEDVNWSKLVWFLQCIPKHSFIL
ncbi:hypothetical protein Tco_0710121 [Tanacetum coccineum]